MLIRWLFENVNVYLNQICVNIVPELLKLKYINVGI